MPPFETLTARDERIACGRRVAAPATADRALTALEAAGMRALVVGSPAGARRFRKDSDQASVPVPGRRPALIDAALLRELDALRAPCHRAQHDHGLTPDPTLLAAHWARLAGVRAEPGRAIDALRAALDPPGQAGP